MTHIERWNAAGIFSTHTHAMGAFKDIWGMETMHILSDFRSLKDAAAAKKRRFFSPSLPCQSRPQNRYEEKCLGKQKAG